MSLFSHIRVSLTKTAMNSATVRAFTESLSGQLVKYDRRLSAGESKRGWSPNIYRLGHYMEALDKVKTDVRAVMDRDDPEAMQVLRNSMARRFTDRFPPVNRVLKQIAAWETAGKFPKYGSEHDDQESP